MKPRKNIPDLRPEMSEVTLEHCSVLLELLQERLADVYEGNPSEFRSACDSLDVADMKDDLLTLYSQKAFTRLFATQFGKGVLLGSFMQKFVMPLADEELD